MKSTAAGFSRDRVSELFNLLERIVEHKVTVIRIYVYNVDAAALMTFLKSRKSDVEKWNITDVVNLKCEERNHYNHCDVPALLAAMHDLW
jgi:hypothetical protein